LEISQGPGSQRFGIGGYPCPFDLRLVTSGYGRSLMGSIHKPQGPGRKGAPAFGVRATCRRCWRIDSGSRLPHSKCCAENELARPCPGFFAAQFMEIFDLQLWTRIGAMNRSSRRKEALTVFPRSRMSLLTSAATRFMARGASGLMRLQFIQILMRRISSSAHGSQPTHNPR
jgi:hypothetical protein